MLEEFPMALEDGRAGRLKSGRPEVSEATVLAQSETPDRERLRKKA